jgi:hypothetical protein
VRAYLALLGQDAVAKAQVLTPERGEDITDSFVIAPDADLGLAVGKFFKVPA